MARDIPFRIKCEVCGEEIRVKSQNYSMVARPAEIDMDKVRDFVAEHHRKHQHKKNNH